MPKNKSFTLIELLVVIVIIGILAGVIMISTSSSIEKANFAKAKAFSANIKDSMMLDLVSEWTFDEPAVNNITKDGWGTNHGTVVGATYKTKESGECVFGSCYSFDGGSDYIDCGDSDSLNITDEITVSAWINMINYNTNQYKTVIARKSSQVTGGCAFQYGISTEWGAGHRIIFWTHKEGLHDCDENNKVYSEEIKLNKWYYVVGSYDSLTGLQKIYLNGQLNASVDKGDNLKIVSSPSLKTKIGAAFTNNDWHFNGSIDDVRIYDTALSSAQIKQNYIAGINSLLAKGSISKEEYDEKIVLLSQK